MWTRISQAEKEEEFPLSSCYQKNQHFAIFTETNYKGLQQQLDAGTGCKDPDAMKFSNDRLQSFRKKWDDQSDSALRLYFVAFVSFF